MHASVSIEVEAAAARLRALLDSHPVWRRRDLIDFGIPDSLQSAMVRRDALVRVRHGVYALPDVSRVDDPTVRHRTDVAAAIAAAAEPTWGFGLSAVLVHRLPLPMPAPDAAYLLRRGDMDLRALTEPSRHRLEIPVTRVTASTRLREEDVTVAWGVPVVSRELAAVTAAAALTSNRWRVALLDAVLWEGTASAESLLELAESWRHLGELTAVRKAIALARPGAQTPLESLSRLALCEEGLPEPLLQAPFHDAAGLIGYVDMWWPEWRVIGEADGALKYSTKSDLMAEKVREDRLRALGFLVVRWTWDEITTQPAAVAERIRRAARRAA